MAKVTINADILVIPINKPLKKPSNLGRERLVPPEALEKALSLIGFKIVKKTKVNDAIYTVLAVKKEK